MDINQILLLLIVILGSIIFALLVFMGITRIANTKREKKTKTKFDMNNLIEEESLMNVLDEKKNVEFATKTDRFLNTDEEIKVVRTDPSIQTPTVDPFGINNKTNADNKQQNQENKFFK